MEVRPPCGHLTVHVDIRVDTWDSGYQKHLRDWLFFRVGLQGSNGLLLRLHSNVGVMLKHLAANVARDGREGLIGHARGTS